MRANFKITIDSEGNGETSFTVPCDWENKHSKDKEGQPRFFYLKEKESGLIIILNL